MVENLRFLVEHGNVTTYEWKYREKPITVEEPTMVFEEKDEDNGAPDSGGIDFGDDEIDFGGDEIDFGGILNTRNNSAECDGDHS